MGKRMTAVRLTEQNDTFVLNDTNQPHDWYSIDPVTAGPASITADLKRETEQKTKPGNVVQPECEMPIITCYKMTPAPDKRYEKKMLDKDPQYPVTLTTVYWDKQQQSEVTKGIARSNPTTT